MDVKTLRTQLQNADEHSRRQVLYSLPATSDPGVAYVVANHLGDPSPAVCEAAVEVLGRLAHETAAAAVAPHLRAAEPAEREYAREALVRLGRHALSVVTPLLNDPDRDVRKYAVDIFASLQLPETLVALLSALHDDDPIVVAAAAEGLGALGQPEAVPALATAFERGPAWVQMAVLPSLGAIGGAEALRVICGASDHYSASPVLVAAAVAAGQAGPADVPRTLAFLIGLLSQNNVALREVTLTSLATLIAGCEESASFAARIPPPIIQALLTPSERETVIAAAHQALNSAHPQARAAAITCLSLMAPEEAVTLLAELTALRADPTPVVRLAVFRALTILKQMAWSALAQAAENKAETPEIRLFAAHQLAEGKLQTETAEELSLTLTRIVDEAREPALRAAAVCALLRHPFPDSRVGRSPGLALLAEEDILTDEAALAEFMACPVWALLPLILDAWAQAQPETHAPIFEALLPLARADELNQTPAGPGLLAQALHNPQWAIRAHAVRLLAENPAAWAGDLLQRACQDSDSRVRAAALGGLSRAGAADEAAISQALADPAPAVRRAGLLAALNLVASHPSPDFQAAVTRAAEAVIRENHADLVEVGQALLRKLAPCST